MKYNVADPKINTKKFNENYWPVTVSQIFTYKANVMPTSKFHTLDKF